MKKLVVAAVLMAVGLAARSQVLCSNFDLITDFNHYTVSGAVDSTFVKYVQFSVSDTGAVSKMNYSFSDLAAGISGQKDYVFSEIPVTADLTVKDNCMRSGRTIKISLGYFDYQEKDFKVTIRLYDAGNNLLGSTDYSFSH